MPEQDSIDELKKQLERATKKIISLEAKIASYEGNGPAKLYYSLNRKSWEMGDLLNSQVLTELDIDDPKSKTFDRLKTVWKDGSELAAAVQSLGLVLGITGDEDKDVKSKRVRTTPETVAEELGDYKKVDV